MTSNESKIVKGDLFSGLDHCSYFSSVLHNMDFPGASVLKNPPVVFRGEEYYFQEKKIGY